MAKHITVRIDLDTIEEHSTRAVFRSQGGWIRLKLRRDKKGNLLWRYPETEMEAISAYGAWVWGGDSNWGMSGWRKIPTDCLKRAFYVIEKVETRVPITEEMYF